MKKFAKESGALLVLYGSTGDLAKKKILPALFSLETMGLLPENWKCVLLGRQNTSSEKILSAALLNTSPERQKHFASPSASENFAKKFIYCKLQMDNPSTYAPFKEILNSFPLDYPTRFFLAVSNEFFLPIVQALKASDCLHKHSAFFLEKPFGDSAFSAKRQHQALHELLYPVPFYLIDHYILKPGISALFAIRKKLPLLEAQWNSTAISKVYILATEPIGIGSRAPFYEAQGHIRDIVQSHVLQMCAFIGANLDEPQTSFSSIRQQFLDSLKLSSSRPAIIGQYKNGTVNGVSVLGYLDEEQVASDSLTETFSALSFTSNSPRWSGVEFVTYSGKRLKKKLTRIVVMFRDGSYIIGDAAPEIAIFSSKLKDRDFSDIVKSMKTQMSSYESVLFSIVQDSLSSDIFLSPQESIQSWKIVDPLFQNRPTLQYYKAGSWGPESLPEYMDVLEFLN